MVHSMVNWLEQISLEGESIRLVQLNHKQDKYCNLAVIDTQTIADHG